MLKSVANHLREVSALLDMPDGDVQQKVYPEPKFKPPRRKPSVKNKSNRSDYMQNYMQDYRNNGKDYQRMPNEVKKKRREFRKKFKDNLKASNPLKAHLLNQEITMWHKQGQTVDHDEFVWLCDRRGFTEEERNILAEDLCDLNLIMF